MVKLTKKVNYLIMATRSKREVSRAEQDMHTRRQTMKITVWMDERGEIWAHHEQGSRREVCFLKTEEETQEELRAWGYPLLVHAYPTAQIEAGQGIEPQELAELFLER
jgi:hypothetical protein